MTRDTYVLPEQEEMRAACEELEDALRAAFEELKAGRRENPDCDEETERRSTSK